jgi:hypothetical protein
MSLTWMVVQLDCLPQDGALEDVVTTVHWQCLGADDAEPTATGRVYGACPVPPPGLPFTPYADLTETQVLEWTWENGVDKAAQEALVAAQIADALNPPIVTPPLPWAEV